MQIDRLEKAKLKAKNIFRNMMLIKKKKIRNYQMIYSMVFIKLQNIINLRYMNQKKELFIDCHIIQTE